MLSKAAYRFNTS
jgi:F-type H+-transporting ATPase subunit gamma